MVARDPAAPEPAAATGVVGGDFVGGERMGLTGAASGSARLASGTLTSRSFARSGSCTFASSGSRPWQPARHAVPINACVRMGQIRRASCMARDILHALCQQIEAPQVGRSRRIRVTSWRSWFSQASRPASCATPRAYASHEPFASSGSGDLGGSPWRASLSRTFHTEQPSRLTRTPPGPCLASTPKTTRRSRCRGCSGSRRARSAPESCRCP